MAKNKLGPNSIARTTFQIKEWWKVHNVSLSEIIKKIKNITDNIKTIYSDYCFIIITILWVAFIIIDRTSVVLTSFVALSIICISILFKYSQINSCAAI